MSEKSGKKTVAQSLSDIGELLFNQAVAITNDDITGEKLKEECERSRSLAEIAEKIIDVNKTIISAAKVQSEYGAARSIVLIGGPNER